MSDPHTAIAERLSLQHRIGERIADEVEKVAHGRQSNCEQAAKDILAMVEDRAEEIEQLRLAICGGEDAPGYAMSLPLETILNVQRENLATAKRDGELAWDGETANTWKARAEKAQADLASARGLFEQVLERQKAEFERQAQSSNASYSRRLVTVEADLASARKALEAQERAEQRDLEHEELCGRANAEGWDEVTGGSHLNDDWKHVTAAYETARTLRREALRASTIGEEGEGKNSSSRDFATTDGGGDNSSLRSDATAGVNADLLAALKPFAALVPIHSDRDDTIRHYAVKVGDVRRARAAIAKASEKQT